MSGHTTIAAVDLGSNSFHCQIARVSGEQFFSLDSLREPVRLGAGLDKHKALTEEAQDRALACLSRFGERLRGLDRADVRAVGTNTLRVAKNAKSFLRRARAALGFPIDVIAGREEARLIYLGVAHELPPSREKRLVIDIGGGSTECIIGSGLEPLTLESLFMGCVSYSKRFFRNGRLSKSAFKDAELAARTELQPIVDAYTQGRWQRAYGSSGTVRALADILAQTGLGSDGITPAGLERLRALLIKAGDMTQIDLPGLRADRRDVLPGGLAILTAAMQELDIDELTPASGALRQGILFDLIGRFQHHDMRDATVSQFMTRYHVDAAQAARVAQHAKALYQKLAADDQAAEEVQLLDRAARLHEIGIAVAYSGYHKHSAYILANADMPGFSREEQEQLATLVGCHRRSLRKALEMQADTGGWLLVLALRMAALLCRARRNQRVPAIDVKVQESRIRLSFDRDWLDANPLTAMALQEEVGEWAQLGVELKIPGLDSIAPAADSDSGD